MEGLWWVVILGDSLSQEGPYQLSHTWEPGTLESLAGYKESSGWLKQLWVEREREEEKKHTAYFLLIRFKEDICCVMSRIGENKIENKLQ